ncbi:hypothetical protein ZWY2020_045010 [Hordeum vulgare]|nr:hypothetical protein ZWY2020_045010 [Hordeum vulgare]
MNCGPPDQLPPATAGFLNLNWDNSMDAGGHPSPASNSAAPTEGLALHGISPRPQQHYGAGTPLGSPTKLNLSMMGQYRHHAHQYPPPPQVGGLPTLENLMPMGSLDQFLADPGFAQRAARLSGFDARGGYGAQLGLPDDGPVGALKELELGSALAELRAGHAAVGVAARVAAAGVLAGVHEGALGPVVGVGAGAGLHLEAVHAEIVGAEEPALEVRQRDQRGELVLALLLAPAPALEVEWPAERLREKGHMLMLMSSALPLTLLTRRSAFLARSLDSPVGLKMSFHLKVTAGRSGVGTAQASASGWTCSAASPSCSGGSEGSLTSASWSWSASSMASWSWPWCWSASGPAGGAWRVWSGRTMPSEKSWSAVTRPVRPERTSAASSSTAGCRSEQARARCMCRCAARTGPQVYSDPELP